MVKDVRIKILNQMVGNMIEFNNLIPLSDVKSRHEMSNIND
jgi:hypothetical protein